MEQKKSRMGGSLVSLKSDNQEQQAKPSTLPKSLADMKNLESIAAANSFKVGRGAFEFSQTAKTGGDPFRVDCGRASLTKNKEASKAILVHVPAALAERLGAEVSGGVSVALCALAEWALNHLEEKREKLIVSNRTNAS